MARAGGAEGERGTCTICTNQINHMPGKIKGALAVALASLLYIVHTIRDHTLITLAHKGT